MTRTTGTTWTIEVHTLVTARTPGPEVYFQRRFGAWEAIAIHTFLLRSGDRLIVVDTGLIDGFEVLNAAMRERKGPEAGFNRVATLDGLLDLLPEAVLLTSFGPYATGGLPLLGADVPVFASARGLADLERPEEPALVHPLPDDVRSRLRTARAVEGIATIADGVTFVEAGVHHPASAAVLVVTETGTVAIADPVFARDNLREGIALGAAEDVPGWYRLVRRLGGLADAVLPVHDPLPEPVPVAAWHPRLRAEGN